MPAIISGRSLAQIARDVNVQAKRAEAAIADLFRDTPEESKHDLMCAILGVVTEIALGNLEANDSSKRMIEHLESLIQNFHHAMELTNRDRQGRVEFCLGCDKDGQCMAQAIVEDWEEHEAVPDHRKS